MRVVIVAVGSMGDVAPYTGLAQALVAAGHEAVIATHEPYRATVESVGLSFRPLPMDPQQVLAGERGRRATGRSPAALRHSIAMIAEHQRDLGAGMLAASRDADALLLSPMAWLGWHVAQGLGIRSAGVYLQPWTPTAEFAPPAMTTRSLGGWGNKAAARFLRTAGQRPARAAIDELRGQFGLEPMTPARSFSEMESQRWPIFYGFSPEVVPPPRDWPSWHRVVGYWWPAVDPSWRPPSELVDFLDAGPAPVFLGFGSMPTDDPQRLSRIVAETVRAAGVRAVVQAGGADLRVDADDVMTVGAVPHSWLFPRTAAVVHHCGAGTAAAGVRAGVPTVPVPVMVDQPFWAQRLQAIGVATPPLALDRLTGPALADRIRRALTDSSLRERAVELSTVLRAEDGYAEVVATVGRW
ncbi:MAG: glycosyltransferase [Candidatus Nanopelagicales bacterium]